MNDKKILINALLLLVFALGIVYSYRYTQKQNEISKAFTSSSTSFSAIGFSSSISAKQVVQVAFSSSKSGIRKLNQSQLVEEILPIQKTLGLKPRYTLKYLDTYIFNIGSTRNIENFSSTVKSLGGEINTITPSDIKKYDLPGQNVAFLNIPSIKDYVLLVLFDGKDMWLVDVPASTYQTRKKQLKVLFDQ